MTTLVTYAMVGVAEDVSSTIANISPSATPFQSMIKSEKVHSRTFEWLEDSLRASAATALINQRHYRVICKSKLGELSGKPYRVMARAISSRASLLRKVQRLFRKEVHPSGWKHLAPLKRVKIQSDLYRNIQQSLRGTEQEITNLLEHICS